MNKPALRAKMAYFGDTYKTLAKAIGVSEVGLNNKINQTNNAQFRQTEIDKIKKRYKLTPEEVMEIFFTE